jgi:hypothetical protein
MSNVDKFLVGELDKLKDDSSIPGIARKVKLGEKLRQSREGGQVGGSSTNAPSSTRQDVTAFGAANITPEMVAKAQLDQLEEWEHLDYGWEDNDLRDLVVARLEKLRAPQSPPPVTTPLQAPSTGGPGSSQQQPVQKQLSREETFAASLKQPAVFLKQPLMAMYGDHPDLAEEVRDTYKTANNPRLPEDLLLRLAQAGLLWRDQNVYRISTGGQNGVVYKFFLDDQGTANPVGEWHVHWGPQNKPENPGWKKGKDGEKVDSNLQTMRKLLGKGWGSTNNVERAHVVI